MKESDTLKHYTKKLVDDISRPTLFIRMLPPTPPLTLRARIGLRIETMKQRIRNAFLALTGKAEIERDEE